MHPAHRTLHRPSLDEVRISQHTRVISKPQPLRFADAHQELIHWRQVKGELQAEISAEKDRLQVDLQLAHRKSDGAELKSAKKAVFESHAPVRNDLLRRLRDVEKHIQSAKLRKQQADARQLPAVSLSDRKEVFLLLLQELRMIRTLLEANLPTPKLEGSEPCSAQ